MRLKPGVVLSLSPSMARVLQSLDRIYEETTGHEMVITSASDGSHRFGSRHYTGEAVDIRTRDIAKSDILAVVKKFKEVLGSWYDVVLEEDHLHVEFDP